MRTAKYCFLNLTSFETGLSLACFPQFFARLASGSHSFKGRVLSQMKWRKLSARKLDSISAEDARSNWIDVSYEDCMLSPSLGKAKWVKGQIIWSATAYFWDKPTSPLSPPSLSIQDTGAIKAAQAEWEASVQVHGIQKLAGLEPSVCSVVWELNQPLTSDEVSKGMIEIVEILAAKRVPDDLRVYGNYGADLYLDGGMNIVFASRSTDENRSMWKERFLKPKPILGGQIEEIENLTKAVGADYHVLNARTTSGKNLAIAILDPDLLASQAAREYFV